MQSNLSALDIHIDFARQFLTFAKLPGQNIRVESSVLTANYQGKECTMTYLEGFDLLPDTNNGAAIEHSRAKPREVCEKVVGCVNDSDEITLTVRVNIKGRASPQSASFKLRFVNGKLEKAA
jgi:hypothetical protein